MEGLLVFSLSKISRTEEFVGISSPTRNEYSDLCGVRLEV